MSLTTVETSSQTNVVTEEANVQTESTTVDQNVQTHVTTREAYVQTDTFEPLVTMMSVDTQTELVSEYCKVYQCVVFVAHSYRSAKI